MDEGGRATQDAKAEFRRVNEHFERDFTESTQSIHCAHGAGSRRLKRRSRWSNQ